MKTIVNVSLEFQQYLPVILVEFADGTVLQLTGNIQLPSPTEALGDVTTATNNLRGTNALIAGGDKSKATKNLQTLQTNKLNAMLTSNAHYVEDRARKLSAGNITMAEEIINGSGYHVRGSALPYNPAFEEADSGDGWAKWRTIKEPGSLATGILWRYGIVEKKNVPPAPGSCITHHTRTLSIKITGFESGTIVAIQYSENELSSQVKRSTPTYNHNEPDPYQWSNFIYTVIP